MRDIAEGSGDTGCVVRGFFKPRIQIRRHFIRGAKLFCHVVGRGLHGLIDGSLGHGVIFQAASSKNSTLTASNGKTMPPPFRAINNACIEQRGDVGMNRLDIAFDTAGGFAYGDGTSAAKRF